MVEIAWDASGDASCGLPSGARLQLGPRAAWTPGELLAAAVANSVMQTFLAAAMDARIPVLAYVASAELRTPDAARPGVDLHARITVAAGVGSSVVEALSKHARRTAPLTRLLSASLAVSSSVDVLVEDGSPAGETVVASAAG